jgi:hypothetical protein
MMEKLDGGYQSKTILIWNFIQNVDGVYCLGYMIFIRDCLGGPKMMDYALMWKANLSKLTMH